MSLLAGLNAYFDLGGNGTGSTDDLTGNNNTGTNTGGLTQTGGPNSNEWALTGFQQAFLRCVTVPNSDSLNPSAITVAAWVRPVSGVGSFRTVLAKRADANSGIWSAPYARYCIRASSTDTFQCWVNDGSIYPGNYVEAPGVTWITTPDSQWHLVAMTYDGTTLVAYNDAAVLGTKTINQALLSSPYNLLIGTSGSVAECWYGDMGPVAIWNRALSAPEISEYFNGGIGLPFPFNVRRMGRPLGSKIIVP